MFDTSKIPLGLAVDWFNEAHVNFVNDTEYLQDVWTTSITDSVDLPSDFLRELSVKSSKDPDIPLEKKPYEWMIMQKSWTDLRYYALYGGKLYVWSVQSSPVTLTVPYVKSPALVTVSNFDSINTSLPSEYREILYDFVLSRYHARRGDTGKQIYYMNEYHRKVEENFGVN